MAKHIISVEISDALKETLRVEAFKHHLTVSALIRQTLEKEFGKTLKECKKELGDDGK